MNSNINLILETTKKIQKTFNNVNSSVDLNNASQKLSFSSKLMHYIEQLYRCLEKFPEGEIKEKIKNKFEETVDVLEEYCDSFDSNLFDSTKQSIDSFCEFIEEQKTESNTKEELIEQYNLKLTIYKSSLKECENNFEKYKTGKRPYEICYEGYIVNYEMYLELEKLYDLIDDKTLKKPKKPKKVSRTVDDLKLKNFLENLKNYESFLSTCEDEYLDYVEIAKKYNSGEISYEEYNIETTKYYNIYLAAEKAYEDLLKEYNEIENNFVDGKDYVIATDEELEVYYEEINQYNDNLTLYQKQLELLEELSVKLSQNIITQEEFDIFYEKFHSFEIKLINENKRLTSKRNIIYNSSVLSRLQIQKKIIEEHLKLTGLSEDEIIRLNEKLTKLKVQIKEIEKFKKTIKIAKIKKAKKTSVSRKSKTSSKKLQIEEPPPFFALGPKKKDINKPLNLVEILTRIKGEENYSKMDGFVEKYKGIKVINYHRFRARTVLDKPFKLIGTAFSSVVVGTGKLFANMAYKFSSKRRARLDAMVQRVNQLSIEEIDFLMENLTTANLVQYQTLMPNAVFHALQNRFSSRRAQLMEEANKYIELMFQKLVEMYNEAKRIQEQLASANLSEDDKRNLRARYDNLLINMFNAKEQIEQARKVDFIANDGSLSDERSLVKENTIGGINSRLKQNISVDRLQRTIALIDIESYGRENLMNIVEMFLYNEKVNIENTKHKRTLRNWFGETSVGSREWRPLIEQFDYVKHDYVGSVVRTALIVVSICNVINQMNLQNQVAQLQQELKVANQKIAYLNGEVARLQGIINTCAGDPAKMVATYSEYLKQQAALYQATCDYYGATAQAAYNGLGTPDMTTADPSGIYADIDNMGHTYSANWIDAINNAQNLPVDQQLKALQAVEEQMQKACVELANKTGNDVMNYVSYKQGFDFSALTSFYSSVGSIDPGFVGEALEKLINLSYATGNVQAIQLINTYNVNVGTAGLVAQLALVLGESAMHIMDENSKETPEKTDIEERKKQLKSLLDTAKIDVHEEARRRFDDANTAWEQKHWFYRFTHRKEKPQLVDFEQEVMDEEISRGRFR